MSKTLIIVPCFNEASRLDVKSYASFIEGHQDIDFIFVDDGSSDGTAALLEGLLESFPGRVEIQKFERNSGKAEAVRQGMLKAVERGADVAGYWDADLSTPLIAIDTLRNCFTVPGRKIVVGSRVMLMGRDIRRKGLRHYLGRVFATTASLLLKLPIYDTQCGAKLFTRDVVPILFREPFVSPWFFDLEILRRFVEYCGRERALECIYEYPLDRWTDVPDSKIKFVDFLRVPVELYKIFGKK